MARGWAGTGREEGFWGRGWGLGWDWEGGGVLGTWLEVGLGLGGRRGAGDVAMGWAGTGREEGFWGRG